MRRRATLAWLLLLLPALVGVWLLPGAVRYATGERASAEVVRLVAGSCRSGRWSSEDCELPVVEVPGAAAVLLPAPVQGAAVGDRVEVRWPAGRPQDAVPARAARRDLVVALALLVAVPAVLGPAALLTRLRRRTRP